jgi:hypothetical protein
MIRGQIVRVSDIRVIRLSEVMQMKSELGELERMVSLNYFHEIY